MLGEADRQVGCSASAFPHPQLTMVLAPACPQETMVLTYRAVHPGDHGACVQSY